MAYALGLAALAVVPLQLIWPKPSDGKQFSYSDIAGDRELFWLVLGLFAAISVVYLPLQALATMHLVRGRGSTAATVGGVLLWIGCGLQAAGVATWAATYSVATDPEIGGTAGRAVIEAANADGLHLGTHLPRRRAGDARHRRPMRRAVPGEGHTGLGPARTALRRAHLVIQSTGPIGLICTIPMTIGALGLAASVVRSTLLG